MRTSTSSDTSASGLGTRRASVLAVLLVEAGDARFLGFDKTEVAALRAERAVESAAETLGIAIVTQTGGCKGSWTAVWRTSTSKFNERGRRLAWRYTRAKKRHLGSIVLAT